tara:strand:- start:1102 stop:1368 length:267 start_codon:yes stop_codon:yes gene_type:complete
MDVKIQKWGRGAEIFLPSAVLEQPSLAVGNVLRLVVTPEAITLKPVSAKPHYKLADLIAQCDVSVPEPADLHAWSLMQSVGREVDLGE